VSSDERAMAKARLVCTVNFRTLVCKKLPSVRIPSVAL
jgi:hypothetical protein